MAAKTDVVIKLVLVFFISLLSFSIGTFVGKKYSDNQHQLSQLEPQKGEKTERDVASVHENSDKKNSGAMSDEEIANLAKEFVADENTPAGEGNKEGAAKEAAQKTEAAGHDTGHENLDAEHNAHGNPHEAVSETKTAPSKLKDKSSPVTSHTEEPSAAAKEIAAGKNPTASEHTKTATVHEGRVPSSLPKEVAAYTVGKFTVQVAAYTDEAEAQKMASDLKEKGYSAFYIPANVKGKTYFRVSVGQFATPKEANAYKTEFISKAKINSAIVQKITE